MVDVFFGEYRHNLDAKGRIIVPAKFREGLGGKFYVTRGMDGCLFVSRRKRMESFARKASKITACQERGSCIRAFLLFGCD